MKNRRHSLRMTIDREASLSTLDGSHIRSCRLRNLSARGARVLIDDHADLPDSIVLHLLGDGVSWPCRIVRRQAGEIGVLFV
jgi:hypothetical protein